MGPARCLTLAGLAVGLCFLFSACRAQEARFCYGDGLCIEPDGQKVLADGQPVCELTNSCGDSPGGPGGGDQAGAGDTAGGGGDTFVDTSCICTPTTDDRDGDCLDNDKEDKNGNDIVESPGLLSGNPDCFDTGDTYDPDTAETDPDDPDTDNDGIPDGCEDLNKNGEWDGVFELKPWARDSDCDGVYDGIEDPNHNGRYEPNNPETWPGGATCDSDEECNTEEWCEQKYCANDGRLCADNTDCGGGTCETKYICTWCDKTCDNNGDPCNDSAQCNGGTCVGLCATVTRGESEPLDPDTDLDGIKDGDEDRDGDGFVDPWFDANKDDCFDTDDGDQPGESDPRSQDTDGDQIVDQTEDKNKDGLCDKNTETCAWDSDSDCDYLLDGFEDLNRNGYVNSTETNPLDPDTDDDNIIDGVEDANGNGSWDGGETDPRLPDTDGDNILDGVEDANWNGVWDYFDDSVNGDGDFCYDYGETAGEFDPRLPDTDGDGVLDNFEDRNQDGECEVEVIEDPLNPGEMIISRYFESCGFVPDTDCDGLLDGIEDTNRNGTYELSELDPRRQDTDNDGLMDGCPAGVDQTECEDHNNNGQVDAGETDPVLVDTDGDELTDGCELNFEGGATDPLNEDFDGDGISDGEEDNNHNCVFEPLSDPCQPASNCPETDPRVPDDPPPVGTIDNAEWNVCAATNLKRLTYAYSSRETHDYRLAFEVEKALTGKTCGTVNDCDSKQVCDNHQCARQEEYFVRSFGLDVDQDGFHPNDTDDDVYGHIFQSPRGVVADAAAPGGFANRDIYGFVIIQEEAGSLNSYMQNLSTALVNTTNADFVEVVEIGSQARRDAHDNLPSAEHPDAGTFGVGYTQMIFRIRTDDASPALLVRNALLTEDQFIGSNQIDPPDMPPTSDPVYGNINCAFDPYCYQYFTVFVSAVQRENQTGPNDNDGVVVLTLALTPDDRCETTGAACSPTQASTNARLYNDRVARLEDLTGGSALARFAADTGKICQQLPQKQAVADILWVVDDSKSMQQTIERLEQASRDAKAILSANAEIVNFRVAMTTTNPSPVFKNRCPDTCDQTCANGACNNDSCDDRLGCYRICDPGCNTSCGGSCDSGCTSTCLLDPDSDPGNPTELDQAIAVDAVAGVNDLHLPGGGGTFYYEDTYYLDCASWKPNPVPGGSPIASEGIDSCLQWLPDFYQDGSDFMGEPRDPLTDHAGFLGSTGAACTPHPVCLLSRLDATTSCSSPDDPTCERLEDPCTDGPTVLASQMCDLIRAMGGIPEIDYLNPIASARPHSAPEHGTRSARRLIESMLPALPADYTGPIDAKTRLRRLCNTGPTCQECDPRIDDDCDLVPLLTIFFSDEEDFFFKDDCHKKALTTDKRQLPERCVWVDGDPTSEESCDPCERRLPCVDTPDCQAAGLTMATCIDNVCTCDECERESACTQDSDCRNNGSPECVNGQCKCSDDNDCESPSSCVDGFCRCGRRAYCEDAGFLHGLPTGYGPDSVARSASGFSLDWRDDDAPQCSNIFLPEPDVSCNRVVGEPCWDNYLTDNVNNIPTMMSESCTPDPCEDQPNQDACEAITLDIGSGPEPYCTWDSGSSRCWNRCAYHTRSHAALQDVQQCACVGVGTNCSGSGDPMCKWVQGYVNYLGTANGRLACQPKYPINDCRACKRFDRMLDAAEGVTQDPGQGNQPLIGFDQVGLVYAIVRQPGVQGFNGHPLPHYGEDPCKGGPLTWGLGDGQGYRDLALETGGRTSDICANSYTEFLGQVIKDIAALSAPYELARTPIAATIKVGIASLKAGTTDEYTYTPVPRSRTQGFYYSSTTNSIAFTSDPIDGVCDNPGVDCQLGNGIEDSEVLYAQNAPTVPKEDDHIFVSYRYWEPVPCLERCEDHETCMRFICQGEETTNDCSPCTGEEVCNLGQCCEIGELIDVCVEDVNCGLCQTFDPGPPGQCVSVGDLCDCNPTGNPVCTPGVFSTCPIGYTCDENCSCVRTPGCAGGFSGAGNLAACLEDLACCQAWEAVSKKCIASVCSGDPTIQCAGASDCSGAGGNCVAIDQPTCDGQPLNVCQDLGLATTRTCADSDDLCTGDAECGLCRVDNATRCTDDNDCALLGGTCEITGNACDDDNECGVCKDNSNTHCTDNSDCAVNIDCDINKVCEWVCDHTVACENPFTCSGGTNAGQTCEVPGDCPSGSCLSPCELYGPCEYVGGVCGFAYPTCCSPNEIADCFADPETGEASLFCRQDCVCEGGCPYPEVCEYVPGLGSCDCYTVPP